MNNKMPILENITLNGKIYSIQKLSDNCFLVRENNKTLSMHTSLEKAEKEFNELRDSMLKGGEKEMDAKKKFDEVGAKLKADVAEKEEKSLEAKQEVLNQLAQIRSNPELAKMYQDNSKLGAENLGGESPQLKVHAVGRSQNELADGSEPKDGNFFYKPTAEEYESIEVHVLTISRGFRAPSFENPEKETFNQIMGGVIVDNGDYKPFIMYFTGLKLSNLWEFGKQIKKYTHARPIGIPMFALTVRLKTEKKANNYGKSWIVNFEIVKNEDGTPKLVLDPGEFQFLKDNVETTEELIDSLVVSKGSKEDEEKEVIQQSRPIKGQVVANDPEEDIDVNELPFI